MAPTQNNLKHNCTFSFQKKKLQGHEKSEKKKNLSSIGGGRGGQDEDEGGGK